MKKAAVLSALLAGFVATQGVLAQGQLQWGNIFGTVVRAPVYGVDPADPYLRRSGNTADGIPAGTQTYGGALLQGTGFTMAIFVGDSASFVLASSQHLDAAPFRTGAAAGFVFSRTAMDPNRPPGTTGVHVQFRAWDNRMGTVTSWSQVLAAGSVAAGCSDVFTIGALGGTAMGDVFLPPQTTGIRSFNITALPFCPIPEPSIVLLCAFGLGALVLYRRR